MTEFRFGTQGFAYKDWQGVFYPSGMGSGRFLEWYSQQFDTVELDTTFYGPPRPATVRQWRDSTPDSFVFAAKMPKAITHEKRLVGAEPELVEFLTALEELQGKLGPILIQLPPSFSTRERDALARFAEILPEEFRYAVEFRHDSWNRTSATDFLSDFHLARAAIDLHGLPRTVETTSDFAYVRLLGNRSDVTRLNEVIIDRSADIDFWTLQFEAMAERTQRIFTYVNNHYAGHSPATVRDLKSRMGQSTPERRVREGQLSLDF